MKWVAGMATVVAVMVLVHLGLAPTRTSSHVGNGSIRENDRIRIVAGVDRPTATPVPPGPAMNIPAPTVTAPPLPEDMTVAKTDTEALDALFDGQARDPAWAPGAEAAVRSRLPAGGDVRCAEFMCRIAMPLPDRSMTASADQQADIVSRHWSADLSYNRFTATTVDDRFAPTLVFYLTRSAVGTRHL